VIDGCRWSGVKEKFVKHLQKRHRDVEISKGKLTMKHIYFLALDPGTVSISRSMFCKRTGWLYVALQRFGYTFLLVEESVAQGSHTFFNFSVQLVGTRDEAKKFEYR
jgi:hypothetical protein